MRFPRRPVILLAVALSLCAPGLAQTAAKESPPAQPAVAAAPLYLRIDLGNEHWGDGRTSIDLVNENIVTVRARGDRFASLVSWPSKEAILQIRSDVLAVINETPKAPPANLPPETTLVTLSAVYAQSHLSKTIVVPLDALTSKAGARLRASLLKLETELPVSILRNQPTTDKPKQATSITDNPRNGKEITHGILKKQDSLHWLFYHPEHDAVTRTDPAIIFTGKSSDNKAKPRIKIVDNENHPVAFALALIQPIPNEKIKPTIGAADIMRLFYNKVAKKPNEMVLIHSDENGFIPLPDATNFIAMIGKTGTFTKRLYLVGKVESEATILFPLTDKDLAAQWKVKIRNPDGSIVPDTKLSIGYPSVKKQPTFKSDETGTIHIPYVGDAYSFTVQYDGKTKIIPKSEIELLKKQQAAQKTVVINL